jgi:tetratricopeptide (TPR) repeat protein
MLLSGSIQAQSSSLLAMGLEKLEARELNEAIDYFNQVLREDPADIGALSGIIKAHLLAENLKDAQRFIDNAIKAHPNNPEFYLSRGILNNLKEQYRRAIDDFNKALEFSTDNIDIQIYINRGVANMQDNNFPAAIDDFTEALMINPRSSTSLNYRAFASYRLGNFIESIEDYNKAIDLNPESAMSYYNRGMAHLRAGDKIKACSDFHQSCSRGNVNACRMIMSECSGVKN